MGIDPSDFTRFEATLDPSNDPPPCKLPIVDRKMLLSNFQQYVQEDLRVRAKLEVRTRKITIGPVGKHSSRARLQDLKPVTLGPDGGLRNNEIGYGKALFCRIISTSALKLTSLQLIMEDSKGFVCLIHLFHLPSNYSEDDLLTLYPPGGYFAIKEPQVREMSQPVVVRGKQTFADSFVIRLESPGDIIRLSPSSAYVKSVNWGLSTTLKVEELIYKVSGNDHFAKGEWLKAFAAYTRVLEGDPSLRGRATVLARSNRAQTLLNLKRPGAALRDCAAALLDPYLSHKSSDSKVQAVRFKIHYRAALAEYQLGRYTAALTRLEFVRKDYPKDTSILELIARTEERVAEANTGIYKWRELFSTFALDPEATLDIADYTGSMITHATVPGKGRGLIATRDIVPGELLLVSRPLASATAQKDALKFLLGVNLYAKMMDSSPNVNLIALLIEKMEDDPSIIPLVYDLHPGDSFSPHGFDYGSMKAEEAIDISRLEGITIFNSFHPEHLIDKTSIEHTKNEERDRVHQPAALYYYPSFMNHSCIGNVTYSFISDTIFMRCREPIKAGEELLDSYVDPMSPLKERQETFTSHGFVCNCQLCQEDQQDSESSKDLRVSIGKEIEETTYSIFLSKEPVMTREILEWIRSKSILFRNSYGKNRKFRPEMYKVTRLLASSLERVGLLIPAIELETEGLEILGGKITKSETGKWTLVEAPKMGDVNSVLSALFIAKQYAQMDKLSESKGWIAIARQIEKGQAGEEVFEVRYLTAAEKMGLVISPTLAIKAIK